MEIEMSTLNTILMLVVAVLLVWYLYEACINNPPHPQLKQNQGPSGNQQGDGDNQRVFVVRL